MTIINGTINLNRPLANTVKYSHDNLPSLTAEQVYNQWCLELGLDSNGTDHTFFGTYSFGVVIPVAKGFFSNIGGDDYIVMNACGTISLCGASTGYTGYDTSATGWYTNYDFGFNSPSYMPPLSPPLVVRMNPIRYAYTGSRAGTKIRSTATVSVMLINAVDGFKGAGSLTQIAVRIEDGYARFLRTAPDYPINSDMNRGVKLATFADDQLHDAVNTDVGAWQDMDVDVELFYEQYDISGTIDENLPLNLFRVSAFDYSGAFSIGSTLVDTDVDPNFQFFFKPSDPLQITVTPEASMWEPNKVLSAGDIVFPTDPSTTAFYFKVSVAGTTGATEPTWINQAGNVVDNTITFAWSGGLIKPVTNAPLIPQLVV